MGALKHVGTLALLLAILIINTSWAQEQGAPMRPLLTREQIDVANCRVLHNGKAGELDVPRMFYALGVAPVVDAPYRLWTAGSVAGELQTADTFHYIVTFKQPITVGSVLASAAQVAVLKPDAPFPGDPGNPAHWASVPLSTSGQVQLMPFDAAVQTRALLFTDLRKSGQSTLGPVRIYSERFVNVAPVAGARAKTEYQAPTNLNNVLHRAIDPAHAKGSWLSTGPNTNGNIPSPAISDVHSQWYILAWDEPHTLSGLYIQDNFSDVKIDVFTPGGGNLTPLAGVESEWTWLKPAQFTSTNLQGRWIAFAKPMQTTGVRFRIFKTQAPQTQVARIDALMAFEDLKDAPRPSLITEPPPPPLSIAYRAPQDGFLTFAIDDAQGRRVRNLVAREERTAGEHREAWDLADENGKLVAPGTYHWKAITAPPLELRYEQTAYPNVSVHHPENSAWLNGNDGPGGWLADHSAPLSVCAAGDFVFCGAPVPESGVGFAACDISGRKLWGIHSFSAWSAGRGMATDGKTVFVQHGGFGAYGSKDEGADRVWAVDIATHKWKSIFVAQNNEQRQRGVSAIAARDGKIVLAVNAIDNYLANSCGWDVVDMAHCKPSYREARKPKIPYEIVPDPLNDFLRLFRLKGAPPGYAPGHGLTYLESTKGPGHKNHILLAFGSPVQIGSCVFPVPAGEPYRVKISALKSDAPYPPNLAKRDQWIEFEHQATLAWDVATAPANTSTRALLISFVKGADDELSDIINTGADIEPETPGGGDVTKHKQGEPGDAPGAWRAQLEGMRILRRRFSNQFGTASVRVNSGKIDKDGVWNAARAEPLSRAAPAIYMLEWKEPQTLRGLAIKEVDAELTEVDTYVGPPGEAIDINGTANWEKITQFVSQRRTNHSGFAAHNANARYLDETIDFGREIATRAIRLRSVSQWVASTREGCCAKDVLGIDPARCRVFGVAPLKYLGGEAAVASTVAERLEIVDGTTGKIEREIAIRKPAQLAYAPDGTLYAVADGVVVKVDLDAGKHQPISVDVKKPGALACDSHGNLYVYDAAPEKRVVRVFDPAGKFLRQIGEPGGYQAGPWNPNRFQELTAIAVDRDGKLWCADTTWFPKRISCWSPEGTFLRDYLGPTQYGGAGVLDPGDKSRLFYGPLEFELDWQTGKSRLKNLTWTGNSEAGEVPIRIKDRVYMVNRSGDSNFSMRCGIVYLYEKDHLRRVAAMGHADALPALQSPEMLKALGKRVLADLQFTWTDRNGDGVPQYDECIFQDKHIPALTQFDDRLETQAGPYRFEVKEFLADGAPVYEEKKLPLPPSKDGLGAYMRLQNGTFYRAGVGAPEACFSAEGQELWSYKQEGAGVGPDRNCKPYSPGQVVCQFMLAGHEVAPEGDLGEFYVINSNFGVWNIWTADGLLAGRIFRDLRDGKRIAWSQKEHERLMRMDDITTGQEHFNAWFCRSRADGKYYAVAGHNHASIVEVSGIEKFKRLNGEIKITPDDISKAQAWTQEVVKFRAREEAKVLDCFSIEGTGLGKRWETLPAARQQTDLFNPGRAVSFQMCNDKANLYARYVVSGAGPFKNTGEQWDRLFKSGACVDLMLGLNPNADPKRRAPVEGDKRVLIGMLKDKPVAVLYDAVVPGAPKDQRWEAISPVGRTEFDAVRQLDGVVVNYEKTDAGYTLEVTLPLKSIGLDPKPGTRIKFDWGVLETDAQGSAVLSRSYWSNKATSTLADAPSEARLEPDLWGWAIFPGRNSETPSFAEPTNLLDKTKSNGKDFDFNLDEK